MTHNICVIGKRGTVSVLLQEKLSRIPEFTVTVLSADEARIQNQAIEKADLVVLCTHDFVSAEIYNLLPAGARVLDVSPAFRYAGGWVYGLPELHQRQDSIRNAKLVANPGCFATSAILLIDPLIAGGFISSYYNFYLDCTGGYTTGGAKLIDAAEKGMLHVETEYGLEREHRHVEEIKYHVGLTGDLCLTPKIMRFARGIRTQTWIPGCDKNEVLNSYREYYEGTDIEIDETLARTVRADEMAGKPNAKLRVFQNGAGCLVMCTMDNLGKGAVDSAVSNIKLMLRL